jgi:SAM-dependent methyltransferase
MTSSESTWQAIRQHSTRSRSVRSLVRYRDLGRAWISARLPTRSYWELPTEQAFRLAYNIILGRDPDPVGQADLLPKLSSGELSRTQLVEWLRGSEEFHNHVRFTMIGPSLHLSRCDFIRTLPRAARILDLGGTHLNCNDGALVTLGYPYPFDELVIIDLPHDQRHELYATSERLDEVLSPKGPVRYRYHSMTELGQYADESFDLVYSGQTIEHVVEEEADHVLSEAARILRPGGHLALDTPNARATRLQQAEFIDPDHKVEYTHRQLRAKLQRAGFEICDAKGLNYLGDSLRKDRFDLGEAAGNRGLYAEIEDCYLLAYVCRRR